MSDARKIEWDWPRVAAGGAGLAVILLLLVKLLLGLQTSGRLAECQSNLQTLSGAAKKYAEKNQGHYPRDLGQLVSEKFLSALPTCPTARQMTYTDYVASERPAAMTVSCCGGHHLTGFSGVGDPNKFPTFSSWTEPSAKK